MAVGRSGELSLQNPDMILERTPQDRSAPSAAVKGLKLHCLRSLSGGLAHSNASQEELRAAKVGARIEPSRSLL